MWRHRPASRSSLTVSLVLGALLLGPLGLAPLARAAQAPEDACCDDACPCEADDGAAEATHDDEAGDHGEGSHSHCPPSCDDCACCPGLPLAIAASPAPPLGTPLGEPLTRAGPERTAVGVHPRPFRPPRVFVG